MKMPVPTAGHLKLESLAGTWEGEETMYPSAWDPKGGTARGRMTGQLTLSGFALIGDYEQERGGKITFTGHSVFTYDPQGDLYTLHWFDCLGTPPEVFTGLWKGDALTLGHGGPGMHARFTYRLVNPRELHTKMEMSQDGQAWNAMFEGRYRRA